MDDKVYLIIRNNAKKKTYFFLLISGFHHHWINHGKQFINQKTILTVLKTFKIRQNASCANTTESIANLSRCS
jgi:genome